MISIVQYTEVALILSYYKQENSMESELLACSVAKPSLHSPKYGTELI